MIYFVEAANRAPFAADIVSMHRQRKAVFVDRARWKVPVIPDQEIDRFDLLEDTLYLLAKDEPEGPLLASARLLPTSGPYLMQELYCKSQRTGFPSGRKVWEASRFCTAPGIAGRNRRLNLLWQIICALLLWPRRHYQRLSRQLDNVEAVPGAMPRGSALVYLDSLTHCAGADRSAAPRTVLIFSCSLGWLKPYENSFLSYQPAVEKAFPPALRDLIGYRIHRPNLGGYEGQDPAVLFETSSHTLPAIDAIPEPIAQELRAFHQAAPQVP